MPAPNILFGVPIKISDRLTTETKNGTLNLTRQPDMRAIPSPTRTNESLQQSVSSIKSILDQYSGAAGSVLDKALTLRDLLADGAASIKIAGNTYSAPATVPVVIDVGSGYSDPRPTLSVPPTPTSLTAQGAFKNVILNWNLLDYANHAYVEIYRFGTNNRASATLIGTSTANLYVDANVVVGATYYYWVRAINQAGAYGADNAVGGTSAALLTIGNTDLTDLVVTAEKLSSGTYPNINLVPNPSAEDDVAAWAIVESFGGGGSFYTNQTFKTGGDRAFVLAKAAVGDGCAAGCRQIPVIPGETYQVSVKVLCNVASAGGLWIRMQESTTKQASGYVTAANRTSTTDLVAGGTTPTAWTPYAFTYTVPAGIYYVSFSVYNWVTSGTTVQMFWDDVSLGRQITAQFMAANSIAVGTAAIQNGAIVNAMIGTAAIDTANIANLAVGNAQIANATITGGKIAASTITAGNIAAGTITATQIASTTITASNIAANTITAGQIASTTITTDRLVANAATVVANGTSGGISTGFTAVTSANSSTSGTVSITSTGSPVTVFLGCDAGITFTSSSVVGAQVEVDLVIDGSVVGANAARIGFGRPAPLSTAFTLRMPFSIVYRHTPSAGAHTYGWRIAGIWYDSSGNGLSATGTLFGDGYIVATENKV